MAVAGVAAGQATRAGGGVVRAEPVAEKVGTIEVAVKDEAGKPVSGATVALGDDRVGRRDKPAVTDGSGVARVQVGGPRNVVGWVGIGRQAVVTVKAKGMAPELVRVEAKEGTARAEVTLKKGQLLTGQLVDAAGNPVTVGQVFLDTWRGARTLVKSLALDDQGKFSWEEAPADEIRADILAPGYRSARQTVIQAGKPNVIVMRAPTLVRGAVVDAATGEAVPEFKVELGTAFEAGEPLVYLPGSLYQFVGTAGKFTRTLEDPRPRMGIRIEAEGYLPADSGDLADDGAEHAVTFKLKKSVPIAGVVTTPEGKPAAGEAVYQVFAFDSFEIMDGKMPDPRHPHTYRTVVTDAAGKYSLPATVDPYALVIHGEAGYAILTPEEVAKSADVRLQKYARVEGTLKQGTKAVAEGIVMMAQYDLAPEPLNHHLVIRSDVKTDGAGHFVVTKMVAGKVDLCRKLPKADGGWDTASDTRVVVKAGDSLQVDVGGVGRPLVGRIELPAELRGGKYGSGLVVLHRDVPMPPLAEPEEALLLTWEERAKWRAAWLATPEGKAAAAANAAAQEASLEARHYRYFQAQADGTFRVEDVTAGDYVLQVNFYRNGDQQTAVARVEAPVKVAVPGGAGGVSDEPLDLGVMTARPVAVVAAGEKAADFSVALSQGRVVRLGDYAGKQVAVVFWSAHVGMSAADVAAMRELAKKQGDGFALLSVNVDEKADIGRKFAEKQGWTFETLYAGPMRRQAGLAMYGDYPRRFLVGKEGTILVANDVAAMVERVGGTAMILK
jgi:peroxiredoxin